VGKQIIDLQDVNTRIATPKSLDFHSNFELKAKSDTTIRALLTHFDTFFSPQSGAEASQESLDTDVDIVKYGVTEYDQEVSSGSSESGTRVSFTTGPRGTETHWRQVVFLLREPIEIRSGELNFDIESSVMSATMACCPDYWVVLTCAGETIQGRFLCQKSKTNSRELDVELHYQSRSDAKERIVATYKVC
jgi:protein arginine N-methyltransferase 3